MVGSGLVVTEGQYMSKLRPSVSGAEFWNDRRDSTKSASESAIVSDGVVHWLFVNNKTFLTNQTPSTPA